MSTLKIKSIRRVKDGQDDNGNALPLVSVEFQQFINNPNQTGGGLVNLFMQGDSRFNQKATRHWQVMTAKSASTLFPEIKDSVTKAVNQGQVSYDMAIEVDHVCQGIPDGDGGHIELGIQINESTIPQNAWQNENREAAAKQIPVDGEMQYLITKEGSAIFRTTSLVPAHDLKHTFIKHEGQSSEYPKGQSVPTVRGELGVSQDVQETQDVPF